MTNKSPGVKTFLSIAISALVFVPQPVFSQEIPTSSPSPEHRVNLATLTGIELGGQISNYRYQEHVVSNSEFMHETGAKFGVTALATQSFYRGFFVTGDFRFAYSSNDYLSGSGTQHNIPDYLFDTRLLLGKDLFATSPLFPGMLVGISPYIGIGYRNLLNDWGGTTSSEAKGYQRDSQYLYLPVGLTHRFAVTGNARVSLNAEYDQLIEGWQTTNLSDVSPAYPNITSNQHGGYGLRGSVMYEQAAWAIGPFFNYWNINQSDMNTFRAYGLRFEGVEPHKG